MTNTTLSGFHNARGTKPQMRWSVQLKGQFSWCLRSRLRLVPAAYALARGFYSWRLRSLAAKIVVLRLNTREATARVLNGRSSYAPGVS